jgi:predicted adenine nucleotide alpha hydrolase (AANH) superfamily ATPase
MKREGIFGILEIAKAQQFEEKLAKLTKLFHFSRKKNSNQILADEKTLEKEQKVRRFDKDSLM